MKIRFIKTYRPSHNNGWTKRSQFTRSEQVEVTATVGKSMVANGHAVQVKDTPEPVEKVTHRAAVMSDAVPAAVKPVAKPVAEKKVPYRSKTYSKKGR